MAGDLADPAPNDPPVLDRAGLERVLARATELQAVVGDRPEALTEHQLLELGSEVGISPEHLRQALAEERDRGLLPAEDGVAVTLAGPACVHAARVVSGAPAAVLAALDAIMQRDEVLVLKRRFPERLAWEAQRGLIGGLRRSLALSGRTYHLAAATDVTASVAAVDEARIHVRLTADFTDVRAHRVELAALSTLGLLVAAIPFMVIGVAPVLAVLPGVLLGGAALAVTRRQYRRLVMRAQLSLEQVLDRLQFGATKPSTAQALLDVIVGAPRLPK
ncbi:MAG TPA: hypothetical protein VHE78_15585 [Gemmatimonadaceae bacterium]|nr:hypothetical protein [Gemmatimonadaceae bacterium]